MYLFNMYKREKYHIRVKGDKIDSTGNKVYGSWSAVKNLVIPKVYKHTYNIPITKTIHHKAVTHQEIKVVKAYDEPVYETHYVCKICGYDAIKDGDAILMHNVNTGHSYHSTEVQVGTKHHKATNKTVTVVDKKAYDEIKIIGYKCICGVKK